jgi:uncharacterized membrane protein YhaH (DUF805 family)
VINKYDHPALAWVMGYWQFMTVLCGLLLLLAGLALIMRRWHQKDEAARLMTYRRVDPAGPSSITSARR